MEVRGFHLKKKEEASTQGTNCTDIVMFLVLLFLLATLRL